MVVPQLILILIIVLGLAASVCDHGQPRKPENAWHGIIATSITIMLLYWGGFWDELLRRLFP